MRTVFVISSAALALVACQKAPGASAPAAGAGATTAGSGELPHRRAGLWQQTISREGQQGGTRAMSAMGGMKICVDPTSEAKASVFSHSAAAERLAGAHCSAPVISRGLDGGYTFSSACPMGAGGTLTTKGTASGDFSSAYHVHVETDVSGANYPAGRHVMDMDGRWLGPCPAGMAAGDIELGNGMRINSGKLAGVAAAMGGGK